MKRPPTSLRLRVVPGAKRSGIVGRHGDGWKVSVVAAPEGGKANKAVLDVLARALDLPRCNLELKAGKGSRDKLVTLDGMSSEVADTMLAAAAEGDR